MFDSVNVLEDKPQEPVLVLVPAPDDPACMIPVFVLKDVEPD